MQERTLYLVASFFFLTIGCNSITTQPKVEAKSFKKEIPLYPDGRPSIFYEFTKGLSQKLNLSDIESGYDSLRIRIWYDFSIISNKKLLDISYSNSKWAGSLYQFVGYMRLNPSRLIVEDLKTKEFTSNFNWDNILQSVKQFKIIELPTMDSIPGLKDGWSDGHSVFFEISTKESYRFYSYHMPEKFAEKFWQAANVIKFLQVLELELNVSKDSW